MEKVAVMRAKMAKRRGTSIVKNCDEGNAKELVLGRENASPFTESANCKCYTCAVDLDALDESIAGLKYQKGM